MKYLIKLIVAATIIIFYTGCSKNKSTQVNNPEPDNLVYRALGTINQIFWLSDDESILLNDGTNGTLKKINTSTKTVQLFDIMSREHLLQRIFYTDQLPNFAYYLAITKDASGSYAPPYKLFSLNLTTGTSVRICDSITQNPLSSGGYTMGNKKLAVKSGQQLLVIDLEQSTSQTLPIAENVHAFSPDDSKMLIFSSTQYPVTAAVYDFLCNCSQPITIAGQGTPFWRSQGIFGYQVTSPATLQFDLRLSDIQSGALIKSFPDYLEGPWILPNGTLVTLLVKGPTYNVDRKAVLINFDLVTRQTKEITTVVHDPYLSFIKGIYLAAVSHNLRKIAYAQNGSELRVSVLQP